MCEDVSGPIDVIIIRITIGSIFYVRLFINFLSALSNLILVTTEWGLAFSMENKILIIATEEIVTYVQLRKQSYPQNLWSRWHWAKSSPSNLLAAMQTLTNIYCLFPPPSNLSLLGKLGGGEWEWFWLNIFLALCLGLSIQLLNENRWWYWNLVLYHSEGGGYGWVSLFLW